MRKKLLKKSAFFILIGLVATISVYSQQMTTGEARSPATEQAQKIRTDLRFPTNVQLDGDLARRIALTERRLQSHPFDLDFIVQDVARTEGKRRRFEEYEGDVSGRLLGAWSYISRLTDSIALPLAFCSTSRRKDGSVSISGVTISTNGGDKTSDMAGYSSVLFSTISLAVIQPPLSPQKSSATTS